MLPVLLALAGVLGLATGSFANVVIHRVPEGASVVSPPSACPHCGKRIAPWNNIPVVSWIVLRGRCADCKAPIRWRYPVVEALTAVAMVAIVWGFGVSPATLVLLPAAWFAITLAAIDIDTRRLPDALTGPWWWVTVATVAAGALWELSWWDGARAAIGAAALGLFYFGAHLAYPRGLGWGDVRVAPTVGAVLAFIGWEELVVGAFAAFVWGLLVSVPALVKAKSLRGVAIPFGPSIFLGAATGVIAGDAVAGWYLGSLVGI